MADRRAMDLQQKPLAFSSVVVGAAAGGIESLITYPTEYIKTRQQLARASGSSVSPLPVLVSTLKNDGVRPMYTGANVFCLSNASKSAVRFATFDVVRGRLPTDPVIGSHSPLSTMFASMCAGVAESVTVLTPGENLKTKLIDSRGSQVGRMSASQALSSVVATEGILGLYRGLVPVAMKQSANAVVRFTSYQFLLEQVSVMLQLRGKGNNAIASAMAGGLAGVVTVYVTMPFDNVKTKLQAINGGRVYRGSFDCMRSVVARDGVMGLWRGTTPRLVRLSVSGVLSFSIYEQVIALMRKADSVGPVARAPTTSF